MTSSLLFYRDGIVYEMEGDRAIKEIDTKGDLSALRELLYFTPASHFAVAPTDQPRPQVVELPAPRGGKRTNDSGLALLKAFEGLEKKVWEKGQLVAIESYQDVGGVWTIGYGHTKTATSNMRISPQKAEDLFIQELEDYEVAVARIVKVPIDDNQFSALVSFAFNLGPAALAGSTLAKRLNQGDFAGAADQFPLWNKAAGQRWLGLTRRRLAERALFLSQPWKPWLSYDGPVVPVISELPSAKSNVKAKPDTSTAGPRSLKLTDPMMQGEDVQQLHDALKQALAAKGLPFKADVVFGAHTEKAVREFQQQQRLTVDGVVGPMTRKALCMS